MNCLAAAVVPSWIAGLITAALAGCVTIWLVVIARCVMGVPVIPYQPRRPVPWNGGHVLLATAAFFSLSLFILLLRVADNVVHLFLATEAPKAEKVEQGSLEHKAARQAAAAINEKDKQPEQPSTEHLITRMVRAARSDPWVWLFAVLAAVVVAPIVEEFLFRVMLLGWLEKVERRHRRALGVIWRVMPGATPICISAVLFGAVHFKTAGEMPAPRVIAAGLVIDAVFKLLALGYVIVLLRRRLGVRAADFGWAPEKFWPDVSLGLLAALAILPPVYLLLMNSLATASSCLSFGLLLAPAPRSSKASR